MSRSCWAVAALVGTVLPPTGWLRAATPDTPVCAKCHPKETERYLSTPMGNSIGSPGARPAGTIAHQRSHAVITIEQRDGGMAHAIAEGGLNAERPVRYQIGVGMIARGYLVQIGDALFESPATWFNSYGWDVSPSYAGRSLIDFDRPIDESCLFCHAGEARFGDTDGRRLSGMAVTPIRCERCHGASEAHVARPSSSNIVNPVKLTAAARDSVCEQCHLEGAARVLNPGKTWADFHPGEVTERTFATYLPAGNAGAEAVAVSHFEQLAESQCARASGGKLWCGTCHQPHGDSGGRSSQIRAVCVSCHAVLSSAEHPAGQAECTSCHMQRRATTDIAHAAITDHRIRRRPAAESGGSAAQVLKVWRTPPAEFTDRDLALAELFAGGSKNIATLREDGVARLDALPTAQRNNDPHVLLALAGWDLQRDKIEDALQFARRAADLRPQSANAAMNLGIVLQRSGDAVQAERQFNRAIELDPSLKQAYAELAVLYSAEHRNVDAIATVDRYLKWNPQDILFRMQRARMAAQR
jgi:Flp pilus assembly protein TadD